MTEKIDVDALSFSKDEVVSILELSERHARRVLSDAGIYPNSSGRWPARAVTNLAINRAIAGNAEAISARLADVTAYCRELEAELKRARRAKK